MKLHWQFGSSCVNLKLRILLQVGLTTADHDYYLIARTPKRKFISDFQRDSKCKCPLQTCPYGIVSEYLNKCPDPFGAGSKELRFMRALTTRGAAKFTLGPMGINTLGKIIPSFNEILPEGLKMENVTAHSGRHAAASIAVNAGVDPITVAKTTKHRDPKVLSRYIHEDENSKLITARAIDTAIIASSRSKDNCSSSSSSSGILKVGVESDAEQEISTFEQCTNRSITYFEDAEEDNSLPVSKKLIKSSASGGGSSNMPVVINFNFYSN